MYILCIYTDKTDVGTDSHTRFRFHIYEKETRIFAKISFFCSFSTSFTDDDFYTIFFAADPAFQYQYVCIVFNGKCCKKSSPPLIFLLDRDREKSVREVAVLLICYQIYRENFAIEIFTRS